MVYKDFKKNILKIFKNFLFRINFFYNFTVKLKSFKNLKKMKTEKSWKILIFWLKLRAFTESLGLNIRFIDRKCKNLLKQR